MRLNVRVSCRAVAAGISFAAALAGTDTNAQTVVAVSPADGPGGIAAALARAHGSGGSTIKLAPGLYRLAAPLRLGPGDSGTAAAPLRIVGTGGAPVILTGGMPATPTEIPPSLAKLLPAAARGRVKAYSLPPAIAAAFAQETARSFVTAQALSPLVVTEGEQLLHLAQWPNQQYEKTDNLSPQPGPGGAPAFRAPPQKAAAWAREPMLRAGGYWTFDWVYESGRVASVDPASGLVTMPRLTTTRYTEGKTVRYHVLNAFSEIDAPGEYAVDPATRTLVVWPLSASPVEIAGLDTLVSIEGAHDIAIEGVALQSVRADALTIHNSSSIAFSNGFLGLTGRNGATVSGGGGVTISGTVISDTGETGASIDGGIKATLQGSGDIVRNSVIRRFGGLTRTYRPGVKVDGVGQIVTGNLIVDAPHCAIIFQGNNHEISLNEIANVVTEASDSSAVYTVHDLASRGTVIQSNYIHDIVRPRDTDPSWSGDDRAVYLDGWSGGIIIRNNLFAATPWPIMVNSGSYNTVSGNVFVGSNPYAVQVVDLGNRFLNPSGLSTRQSAAGLSPAMLRAYRIAPSDSSLTVGRPINNVIGRNLIAGGQGIAYVLLNAQPVPSLQVAANQKSDVQSIFSAGAAGSSLSDYLAFAHAKGFLNTVTPVMLDRERALAGLRYLSLQP